MSEVKPPTSASLRAAEEWLSERPRNSRDAAGLAAMVDGVRRAALGQAADTLKAKADSLFAWMEKQEVGTAKRTELSLRAGELYTAEAAIRALMEGE